MNNQTIRELDEAIRLNPDDATVYLNRGYAYFLKGEYDNAIADYDEAVRLKPEYAIAYYNRGHAYMAKYKERFGLTSADYKRRKDALDDALDNAKADYAKAVRLDAPENAITSIDGSVYSDYSQGTDDYWDDWEPDWEEEHHRNSNIAACTEAIRLDPKNAKAYESRGFSYHQKGNYDQAIKDYDEAIRLTHKDNSANLRESRGDAYYQKCDYDKAIEDYNQAIHIDPIDAIDAYMKLGDAHSEKLNVNRTCKVCSEVIEANLEKATAYHNKGYAYYKGGKYEQAIINYNEAIKLDPENSKVYVDRGDAYQKKSDIGVDAMGYVGVRHAKEDIDMAISDYNEAIRRDPGDVVAYFNRGHAYLKKSDIELAAAAYDRIVNIDTLNQAIQCNPGDAISYFSRGYMYFKQGNIDLAIADYDNIVRFCPNYESDFADAAFADGGRYAFMKVIEQLESMIGAPSPENAADFYYCGLRALFSFSRTEAREWFTKSLNHGYEDSAKIERHLENIKKLDRVEECAERMGLQETSRALPARRRRRRRRAHPRYSARLQRRSARSQLNRWQTSGFLAIERLDNFLGRSRLKPWGWLTPEKRHLYREAIANYSKTIWHNPEDTNAYNNRGYAYFQRGEYDLAIADYNKVIQLDPKDITAYFNKSSACYEKGYVDLYIVHHAPAGSIKCALLDETIRFNPKSTETYIERGDFYFNERNAHDMAITDYTEAIRLSPEYAKAYYSRAGAYYAIARNAYKLTKYDDAIVDYSKAITDYKEAWQKGFPSTQNSAEMELLRGIFGLPSVSYDSSYDSLSYAYVNRGAIYAKKGNYDLAIADMSEAIRHQRNVKTPMAYFGSNPAARAYNNRGFYYYKIGEYDKAIKDLQEAVSIYVEQMLGGYNVTPDYAIMYLNLGSIYHTKGDVDKAIENYDNVVRTSSNYTEDFVNSNFAHGGQEGVDEAVKLLDKIVDDYCDIGNFAPAAYYSGVSILFSGNKHRARRRFERARELGFDDCDKIAEHLENLK